MNCTLSTLLQHMIQGYSQAAAQELWLSPSVSPDRQEATFFSPAPNPDFLYLSPFLQERKRMQNYAKYNTGSSRGLRASSPQLLNPSFLYLSLGSHHWALRSAQGDHLHSSYIPLCSNYITIALLPPDKKVNYSFQKDDSFHTCGF